MFKSIHNLNYKVSLLILVVISISLLFVNVQAATKIKHSERGAKLVNTYENFINNFRGKKIIKTPIIDQPYKFACNVTAASIVLQYRGINVNPEDVFSAIPKDNTPKTTERWGNPNKGFVGNIFGEYGGDFSDGYGVHWQPIADYISKYRSVEVKQNWDIKSMLDEVDKGNPSIVWIQNGSTPPNKFSWTTSGENGEDLQIDAVWGMHSEVVTGYVGSSVNPSMIIMSDPWAERWNYKYHYMPIEDFNDLWSYYNYTAILVR
jgi:uncharacterized protein YvpB